MKTDHWNVPMIRIPHIYRCVVLACCIVVGCDRNGTAPAPTLASRPGVAADGDYAIEFSGAEAFVTSLTYDGKHPITIELVACPTTLPTLRDSSLCSNQEGSGLGIGLSSERRWRLEVADGRHYKAVCSNRPAVVNRRVHIAGMFDGRQLRLAIDGTIQKGSASVNAHGVSRLPFLIGANPAARNIPSDMFRGVIDEVRISDIIRYEENFTPETRFAPDSHTMALYHLDEGKGIIANDASGRNRHATLRGDECWCSAAASWDRSARCERLRVRLAEARSERGFSREQLAARLSRPAAFVTAYETGARGLDAVALRSVARALDIDPTALLDQIDQKR